MPTPIDRIRAEARLALQRAHLDDPAAATDALLAAVLGRTRGEVQLDALLGRELDDEAVARIRHAVALRARRTPLQHIVGVAPFAGLDLEVGPGVFVPRPETELLVELAVEELAGVGEHQVRTADLGSGTGAVALGVSTLLDARGIDARVLAVEGSPRAWPWLLRNVRRHGRGRVHPVFDRIGPRSLADAGGPLDALLSNPPYVPRANEPRDPEVRGYDPDMALYGGDDGLDVVRDIAVLGRATLAPGGLLLLEHDDHHGPAVRDVLAQHGYRSPRTHQDLAGRDRVTGARR